MDAMQAITLTSDQQSASDAFTGFLLGSDVEMVISGGAGVGKSTLLSYMMEQFTKHNTLLNILGQRGMDQVVVSATTNKAAAVLTDMIGTDVSTIHSLLGLIIKNDYGTGKTTLTTKRRPDEGPALRNSLIVIDECSMIDNELYGWIHRLTENCKFLYIGDHCQMAPVGEPISMVFKRDLGLFRLNEIIRSKNSPPITELCQNLRQTVETGQFFEIEPSPGYVEYLDDDGMREKLSQYIDMPEGERPFRVLCYTNNRVNQFNALIRQMRGLPEELIAGETVVSNQATIIRGGQGARLRIEEEVQILHIEDQIQVLAGVLECRSIFTSRGELLVPLRPLELQLAIKHFAKNKDWHSYFTLKEQVAELRPRDACTVYKAQGSTYDTVFVDLGNIGTCNMPGQTARMLYVACSRPQNKIYLYGQLPPKYRS